MGEPLTGSCLCGAVRLRLSGEPYRVGVCHCMDCRKKSGGIFSSWAIYPRQAVTVIGETVEHERGDYARQFCAACYSPLYELGDGWDEIEVFVGVLDEPNLLTPTYETFAVRREHWLPPFSLARSYDRTREGTGRSEP